MATFPFLFPFGFETASLPDAPVGGVLAKGSRLLLVEIVSDWCSSPSSRLDVFISGELFVSSRDEIVVAESVNVSEQSSRINLSH